MSESTGYSVSTTLKANTSKFKNEIESAIKKIEKFHKIASKIDDIILKVNDKLLQSKLSKAEQTIKRFEREKHIIDIDSNVQQALTKVSQLEQVYNVLDNKKIESLIDVSDEVARLKVTNFNTAFNKLNQDTAKPNIKVDDSEAKSKLNKISFDLKRLDGSKIDTKVIANTNDAINKLNHYKTIANILDNKRINTAVNLSDKLFILKAAQVNQIIRKLNGKQAKTRVQVETAAGIAKVFLFKKVLKSIPNRIKVKPETDTNVFSKALDDLNEKCNLFNKRMDKLATSIRTFGTIGSNVIRGLIIASFTALIPIIASLIPLIALIGNSLAIVGVGALGLAGSFGVAAGGVLVFGLMAKSAISMLNNGLIRASVATNSYITSLNQLKNTWQSIIQSNSTAIFTAMSSAIQAVTSALNQLKPFISGVSQSIEGAMQKFLSWINVSETAKNAFKTLNSDGVSVFNNILSAAGKFGDGLTSILTQFSPLFAFLAQELDSLAEKFDAWSTQVSTSEGITNFINYIKTNLPVIGKIFLDTFMGIINIFKAFGSNSSSLLDTIATLASQFRTWSDNLAQSQGFKKFIDYINENGPKLASLVANIALAFINFVTAMAPIGSVVLSVLNSVAGFVAKLFEAHPAIAQIIGVIIMFGGSLMAIVPHLVGIATFIPRLISGFSLLRGIFTVLSTVGSILVQGLSLIGSVLASISAPVLAVVAVIGILIGVFVYLWNKNEGFRNAIISAWNEIKNIFLTVVNAIASFIISAWGALVSWWEEKQQTTSNTVSVAWNTIVSFISSVINTVVSFVMTVWGTLVTWWQQNQQIIQTAVTIVWNTIVSLVSSVISAISSSVMSIWGALVSWWQQNNQSILSAVMMAWNFIVSIVTTVIGAVVSFVMSIWGVLVTWWQQNNQLIMDTIMTIWNGISTYLMTIINIIVAIIQAGWNMVVIVVQTVWTIITTVIQTAISVVLSIITLIMQLITGNWSGAWQTIQTIGSTIWNAIVTIASALFNGLMAILGGIWRGIVNIARTLWDFLKQTIVEKIVSAYHFVVSTAQQIWSTISSKFSQIVSTVREKMVEFFNNIKEKVTNALNTVKNFAKDFLSAGKDLIMGLIDGVASMGRKLIEKVEGVVGDAIDAAKNLLGIASPSKVFKSFGRFTMLGLIVGIDQLSGSVVSSIKNVADKMTNVFNPNLTAPKIDDVVGNFSNLDGNINSMVQHTHTFDINPHKKTVRIEMNIDNDALTSIVNDRNAMRNSIFEF